MNRTRIEWTTFTWNFIVGCLRGCGYCYARRQAKRFKHRCLRCYRFEPHTHPERLDQPLKVKKPALIFATSMSEPFGPWIPREWLEQILDVARRCPQHVFQLLTKCPEGAKRYRFPENCWIGTSVDDPDALGRIDILRTVSAPVRFVSFEPLLGRMKGLHLRGVDWAIIGAQTGPRAVEVDPQWVEEIIQDCRAASVPVFVKDNVNWPEQIREWPGVYHRPPVVGR